MKKEELKSLSLNTKLRICYTYFKQELPEFAEDIKDFKEYKYISYKSFKYSSADYYDNNFIAYIDDLLYDYINGFFGAP